MANTKVNVEFHVDGIEQSVSSVGELQTALTGVNTQAEKTEKSLEETAQAAKEMGEAAKGAGEQGEAGVKLIDEATGGLGTKLKESGKAVVTLGKGFVKSFKAGVQGASAMGKALIATGIGAIIVGVGLLVAYWDDIKGAVSGVSDEMANQTAEAEANVAAQQEALDAISEQENTLKLAGATEREILDLKIAQTSELISAKESQLELARQQADEQVAVIERNKKIAQNVIRILTLPLTMILKTVDMMTAAISLIPGIDIETNLEEGFSGGVANMLFDPEETREEADATLAESEKAITKLKNQRDGFILQGRAKDSQAAKDRKNTQAELNSELEKLRAENLEDAEAKALKLLEIQRKAERQALVDKKASAELLLEFDKQTETQRKDIVDQFAAQRKAEAEKEEQEAAEKRQLINDMLAQADLDKIENQFELARRELKIQQDLDIAKLESAGATQEEINKINKAYTKKNKDLAKEEADFNKALKKAELNAALEVAASAFDAIADLSGESSNAGKAAAVASATINTYLGATSAYAQTTGGPVIKGIAAGVAVAAGLANIKKILAVETPGPSSSGGGGGGVSLPAIPSFDPAAALDTASADQIGNTEFTLGEQTGSSGASVIKAYVVSDEMTTQQERDKKINDLARL